MSEKSGAATAFAVGAILYPALELLWRRKTHYTMSLLGGICLSAIYGIERRFRRSPPITRLLLSAGAVTAAEFAAGCLLNRLLKLKIWDYSKQKANILGQICPQYCLMWLGLCVPAGGLCRRIAALTAARPRSIIKTNR